MITYKGGKKHWADVIKNSGEGNLSNLATTRGRFNINSTLLLCPAKRLSLSEVA
jgi:hypothetical protein